MGGCALSLGSGSKGKGTFFIQGTEGIRLTYWCDVQRNQPSPLVHPSPSGACCVRVRGDRDGVSRWDGGV